MRREDWSVYVHDLKDREIREAFARVPAGTFEMGLEIGAGDCYQSGLLRKYVRRLTCTDYLLDPEDLPARDGVTYRSCDAEALRECFGPGQFDIVFSSNVFEHLPDPERALRGVHAVLKDDGVTINIMPNPFWKLTQLLLFYPAKAADLAELIADPTERARARRAMSRKLRRFLPLSKGESLEGGHGHVDNNPKGTRRPPSTIRLWVWPFPHGAYRTNVGELFAYRRLRWVAMFRAEGFDVLAVLNGPVTSGYRIGPRSLGLMLERLGLASMYTYVCAKSGKISSHASHFQRSRHRGPA